MRILITGGSGFVGRHVLHHLLVENADVYLLLRALDSLDVAIREKLEDKIVVTTEPDWKQKVEKINPDVVLNLAAYLTSSDNERDIENLIQSNITFGTNLLDALRNTSVQLFINTGTFAEYFNNDGRLIPAYLYAATKTAFRSILSYYQQLIGFKILNVIPYTIYGGVDTKKKLIDFIYSSLDSETPVNMSPGDQILDFIHMQDVVDFFALSIKSATLFTDTYSEVHLGTGTGTTPKRIAALMQQITGKKVNIHWGAIPYRKTDTMKAVAPSTGYSTIKWQPKTDIEAGLKSFIQLHHN